MTAPPAASVSTTPLKAALAVYVAASLLHFIHNAEFVGDWPNLPAGLTRGVVYASWLAITAIGVAGGLLWRAGRPGWGAAVLATYAAIGFDGLLHYTRAPMTAHTATMNFTVWFEAAAAAMLLLAILVTFTRWGTGR